MIVMKIILADFTFVNFADDDELCCCVWGKELICKFFYHILYILMLCSFARSSCFVHNSVT